MSCRLLALPVLVLAVLSPGCASGPRIWDVTKGEVFQPTNFVAAGPLPNNVRRVAVLPMHSEEWNPDDVQPIESAFVRELGQYNLFEVIPVSREDLVGQFGVGSYHSAAAVPADFLRQFTQNLGVDAILFTDLTHYSPYQPISIGIRSKLVSARDGHLLWSFDTVFDSARPEVQTAASHYHRDLSHPAYPLEDASAILQSPSRFAKYVAYATYATIPPRKIE